MWMATKNAQTATYGLPFRSTIPPPADPKLRAEWEAAKARRAREGLGKFVGD